MFSDSSRGQTEPLAALIAVSAVAIGIGLYAAFVTGVLPGASAESVEEPTIQRIWSETQEQGVYDATEDQLDDVPEAAIPRGDSVYVAVTTADDEAQRVLQEQAIFDESGEVLVDGGGIRITPEPDFPPEAASNITRPIPVRIGPGDVTAGTLRVVVW